jgi:hypothetical protein
VALQRIGALVASLTQRNEAGAEADSDSEDEGDWLRSGEVQTPAVEALKGALEQDGHAGPSGSKDLRGFFPWNPFTPRTADERAPTSGSTTPVTTDARGSMAPTFSTGDSPLDVTALKRVSLKWNPFAPRSKTPAPGNGDDHPTTSAPSSSDRSPTATGQGPADPEAQPSSPTPSTTAHVSDTRLALERKVVDSLCSLFGAGQFFFSYDADITRSPVTASGGGQLAPGGSSGLPLWRRVRREYWWNEWLSGDLTEIGVSPVNPPRDPQRRRY